MLSALAEGPVRIENLSPGADVRSTGLCMRKLGADVEVRADACVVTGVGARGLRDPAEALDCGNSGTTMRLLAGIVAGARLNAMLDGDASLRRRPMRRVLEPLREMGARCAGEQSDGEERAPLLFQAGPALRGRHHELKVSSAQVKSCILLAGLFAEGETSVNEPHPSRDHTERMLPMFGVAVGAAPASVRGVSGPLRGPDRLVVPGDFSSAAFLLAAGALTPGSDIVIENVNLNPRRAGFLRTLLAMGADIVSETVEPPNGEPVGALRVRGGAQLRAIDVTAADVPDMVDEITLLAIVASQAQGVTKITGARELRVKESDRLLQVSRNLRAMGARIEELPDGLIVEGGQPLTAARIEPAHDHRMAMGFAIAGLCADGETVIENAQWADISYPGYFEMLSNLSGGKASVEP
jgi:3-phosphoshikimate 1-carboxyvinyltransferase